MYSPRFSIAMLVLVGCGDDGATPHDAPLPTGDIDNGSCGDTVRFTGEYIDWDSDQSFCGIFEAAFEVQGDGAMDTTAPNGRFDLCVPNQPVTLLDITPSADASPCAMTAGSYALPGIAVANRDVIFSGAAWSGRAFTMNRQPVDAGKSHVFVNVVGTPRAVALAASHGTVQAVATTTWGPGDTGKAVFFPDVDPAGGSTMLSVTGGAIGTGSIPLVAGKMTNVTVVVQ